MKPIIISTGRYTYLRDRLQEHDDFELHSVESKIFPDGEQYHCIAGDVEDRDVILVGGTIDDTETLELFDLGCALVQCGAKSLTLVIPYFGYSTMERAVKHGEVIKGKTRAVLLSAIPHAGRGNRIVLLDLHTEGLPYYFDPAVRPVHLYAKPVILEAARQLGGDNFVLASTDAGRAKWVESLALDLGVPAAFVYKQRLSGTDTKITGINADVNGRHVIVYDDMIRTGGSLINAAKAYRDAGATEVSVLATHGLFSGDGLTRLRKSGLINKVVVTDTHPNAVNLQDDFLEVHSIAPLLIHQLRKGEHV